MLFLISPAKALDFETPPHIKTHTQPLFTKQSAALIEVLRDKSPLQIAELMKLSDQLSGLNAARYQAWRPRFTEKNSKQAVLAFDGDVYGGLDAKSLGETELDWMQPYRLEMGTRLVTPQGKNLYQFWGSQIADYLNQRAAADLSPVVINLASEEYFKAVDRKALKPRVVTCVFEERKADGYKIISFMAKRARGLMVRYAVQHRATTPEQLKAFDVEGYRFVKAASEPERLVFRRDQKR
jgi:uncharacterized protein